MALACFAVDRASLAAQPRALVDELLAPRAIAVDADDGARRHDVGAGLHHLVVRFVLRVLLERAVAELHDVAAVGALSDCQVETSSALSLSPALTSPAQAANFLSRADDAASVAGAVGVAELEADRRSAPFSSLNGSTCRTSIVVVKCFGFSHRRRRRERGRAEGAQAHGYAFIAALWPAAGPGSGSHRSPSDALVERARGRALEREPHVGPEELGELLEIRAAR